MADVHSADQRRRNMAAIRHKNTKSEILIRAKLHKRGFRFRIHRKDLPGNPDIVLPKYNAVVLVNGCFWHGHECHLFKWPKTRREFWHKKISANVIRDLNNVAALQALGFRVCIVWECALKGPRRLNSDNLVDSIAAWIKTDSINVEIPDSTSVRQQI